MTLTTFNLAAGTDDGHAQRSSGSYAVVTGGGGTLIASSTATKFTIARGLSGGTYYITAAFMRWDTSALPDLAVISAATLDIYVQGKGDPDALNLVGDWYDFGGTPADATDWANPPGGTAAITGTAISALTASTVNTVTLANPTQINVAGYTGIRIGISKRGSDAAPTGDGFVDFASFEDTNQEPRLNVTYTLGGSTIHNTMLMGCG